jgi:hypothetical protein
MSPAIILEDRIEKLRNAFASEPALILERRVAWSGRCRKVSLWWAHPRTRPCMLWGGEIAQWPESNADAWVAGISALMAELRRLRREHERKRWEDVVDG